MPFVEGGIVVDAEPQQQAAPPMAQGGFVQGGIEVDPTPEDSYNKVLQFQAAQTDYTPSKQEFLDYLKVSKTKPLLGDTPFATMGAAALETGKMLATLPYTAGEAISETIIMPEEGVTRGQAVGGTAAEIAMQSRLKAESMGRGLLDTALNKLSDLTGKLRNDDDKYEAFLAAAEIKRQLARANAPEDQRVPAAQEVLQAYGIPQEAISQAGLEVGGFAADPSSIAFAGGGRLASMALQAGAAQIPRISAALQRGGEGVSAAARMPEEMLGRATTAVTGSERMGQAAQGAVSTGTTGIALGEAAGLPISGTLNIPGVGTASRIIGGTKALGGTMETLGEAGAISGGQSLTPIQRGLLGAGERIAAAEGASAAARALGTAVARSGLEAPIKGAVSILVPMAGAGAAGGLLAGLSGEEGDAVAAAIGSGAAFGAFDAGFRLAKAASTDAFKGGRVRQTAVDDLNTRPTDVQFTYVDPVVGEQTVTIKDADARAKLYANLDNKQLTKALSEVAGAENSGVDVVFHTDADTVPTPLQSVNYAGVSIGPDNIKSGKPTLLINVDKAKPETLPHEILHAKITQDVVNQLGAKAIDTASTDPNFQRQFTDFANKYADKLESVGGRVVADRIRTELRDAFDPALQRAQQVASLKRITDEFAAYYTQEFLKGKDPKTMLPGRIPSFIELAVNNAKEAVSERFTRRALEAGFDPVARTFYDANGRRIKIPWMEDAIRNLVTPKEGYEPTEQKVDTSKMTKAQQNAVIMARGYSDLFMTAPDGSIIRPLSKAELAAKTADVANRTMRVVESVPQAERTSISGMDAKGNPVIEGRLSLREADALSQSGIFSPSTSRYIIDIASAIRDGTLMEGKYWKVFGSTGKSGVFGEADKLFLPYGVSINSKGGVNVKVVDWGKVQARMYKALTKPAYKNLFRNYDQAMSTLKDVYLKNIAEQNAVPSADALGGGLEGAKKRNFFNEVMGAVPRQGDVMSNLPTAGYVANRKGGSVYQDLRIERIQNAQPTGSNIPWSGDMGEQSSYRRTQLNFQPAETIGETTVSTDQNAGYRILSKNGKFRLYGPDGSTAGIFDTQEQAKLKAEKDYATQARLQPEVDQQQRVPGDEGRQTAEAGGGNRALGGTEGQGEGGAVRQAGDVRFMPSDSDYLEAVNSGDTATAQRMVDEAAKAAGYTIGPVYHGTPTGGFNVFDKRMRGETSGVSRQAFSFTTDKKAAEGYSKRLGDEAVRLDAGLRVANDAMRMFDEDVAAQEYFSSKGYSSVDDGMLPEFDWGSIDDVPEFIKELRGYAKDLKPINKRLSDSFIEAAKVMTSTKAVPEVKRVFLRIPEGAPVFQATPQTLGQVMSGFSAENQPTKAGIVELPGNERIYYVADSSQVKLVDAITKDNSGNVIPLSQRFKATSEDIRFMPASDQDTKALQMLPKPRRSLDAAYRDGVKTRSQDPQYYDVPDYVGYDMARTAAFEMGREGAEPPRWVMAERIGKLPTEGRSKNFAEDRMERGVSVLRIVGEPQSDVGTYEMFNPGEKRYVAGWLVGLGSDGEPLLADAVDLGPASSDVRMMPSPDSAMPGAYSFPGGYRALPGKAKGSLRLYGPAGSLIGIAASLDEAQRIIRKKSKQ
jgi:hypothetical protein